MFSLEMSYLLIFVAYLSQEIFIYERMRDLSDPMHIDYLKTMVKALEDRPVCGRVSLFAPAIALATVSFIYGRAFGYHHSFAIIFQILVFVMVIRSIIHYHYILGLLEKKNDIGFDATFNQEEFAVTRPKKILTTKNQKEILDYIKNSQLQEHDSGAKALVPTLEKVYFDVQKNKEFEVYKDEGRWVLEEIDVSWTTKSKKLYEPYDLTKMGIFSLLEALVASAVLSLSVFLEF